MQTEPPPLDVSHVPHDAQQGQARRGHRLLPELFVCQPRALVQQGRAVVVEPLLERLSLGTLQLGLGAVEGRCGPVSHARTLLPPADMIRRVFAEVGYLCLQRRALGLRLEPPPYAGKRQPVSDQVDDLLDPGDVRAAVATLAAVGTRRGDEVVLLDPTQERLLDVEQLRHLADGEERPSRVVDRLHGRPLSTCGHQLSICCWLVPLRTSMRRGRAFSASLSVSVSTPST